MSDFMAIVPAASDELEVVSDDDVVWPPANETAQARSARIERERIMLEEAQEDVRQGRVLSGPALDDWLRRWAAGEPLEIPFPRR